MISHIYLGVADFERSLAFYMPLMAELGLLQKFSDPVKAWAAWVAPDAPRPLFLIGKPYDGGPAAPGNGQMVALLAASRASVDRAYAMAMAQGGQCEGAPGLRPHYHPDYYGAYFRDLDRNKICICCHQPA
ncbi:VOC family protein [Roseateles albus]|uniref:VOC family protein n=1 Tax=Roseateles albus TaxID=2987525 RepID=A0ABT5KAY8_9BURK|nr:VOC family protein [Roseateles albus]